ncbi:PleD family two-component system response regulator [Planctomycetota bacterium]
MATKRILLIDDEPDALMILGTSLEVRGYTVMTADNGMDGLTQASQERPDAIILDVMMPEMSGGEVAAKLREIPQTKDIPIIFLTGLISKEEEDANSQCVGNNLTLAKPFDVEELVKMIESVACV